ncbi:MAG: hypothetical protein SFU98_19045 [Leptospiraceae bacterium]|nr:hypothetical protein [Leptospiraceae bacterium]
MNKSDTELGDTWLFQILFQAAGNAVKSRAYYDAINQYKYVSSEFGNININDNYKTINDGVGVLLGIERKNSPSSLNFDNQKIFMISITALMNIEFEMMMENGKEGRENVVRKLKEKNLNNVIDLHREKIEI